VRIPARRCLIASRRLCPDPGLSSTLPACPLPAALPRMEAWLLHFAPVTGSPRVLRAWPVAWPSPSGPLGWQRLRGQRRAAGASRAAMPRR
jgi:hypothetical protein